MSNNYRPPFEHSTNETSVTAFGIPKISIDKTLVYGLFTYDVPNNQWIVKENQVELLNNSLSTRVISVNGKLEVHSGSDNGGCGCLHSRRNPRYRR